MIVEFHWYLHDSADASEMKEALPRFIDSELPPDFDLDEMIENMSRPFYEVRLHCEYDTETHEVKIISVATT